MSDSEVRDANGRFVKGHPGGPGRPRNPLSAALPDLDRLGIEVAQRLIGVVARWLPCQAECTRARTNDAGDRACERNRA